MLESLLVKRELNKNANADKLSFMNDLKNIPVIDVFFNINRIFVLRERCIDF